MTQGDLFIKPKEMRYPLTPANMEALKQTLSDGMERMLDILWPHQRVALHEAMSYEKTNKGVLQTKILKGVLALRPGEGKTRVALTLALSDTTANTLIIVPKLLLSHWSEEASKLGVAMEMSAMGVCYNENIMIVAHNNVNAVQNLRKYHRLIYDEVDCVVTARGKRIVTFAHGEPRIQWVLNGTLIANEYLTAKEYTRYIDGPDRRLRGINETSYIPPDFDSAKRGWGNKFYPVNTIVCDPAFVNESQQLDLLEPIITTHTFRTAVANSVGLLNDKIEQFAVNDDYEGLQKFMEEDSGVSRVNLHEYAKIILDRNAKTETHLHDQLEKLDASNPIIQKSIENIKAAINELRTKSTIISAKCQSSNTCAICWSDDAENGVKALTSCCYTHFCCVCIIAWLSKNATCPYCRRQCDIKKVVHISDKTSPATNEVVRTKYEQVDSILAAHQNGEKILVYDDERQAYSRLPEAKEIEQQIRLFKDPTSGYDVLRLGGALNAKGHDFSFVSLILILDARTNEEVAQIIGRAQRPNRDKAHQLRVHMFELQKL